MGGAAKHILHLYEDLDITFRRIKDIFADIGYGKINEVYEKCDGINLLVTWDYNVDELRVARNKTHIKEGGLNLEKIKSKFIDKPQLSEAFEGAYLALSEAFGKLQEKSEIFGATGGIWFSTEIIDPNAYNLIKYDNKNIVFHRHGPALFGFGGQQLEADLTRNINLINLYENKLNEHLSDSKWKIHAPHPILVKPIDESVVIQHQRMIDNICVQSQVMPHNTIREYLYKRLRDDFQRYPLIHPVIKQAVAANLSNMPLAPSMSKITKDLNKTIKEQINQMEASGKKIIKKLLRPIEETIHSFGHNVLSGMRSFYIEDHELELKRLREEIRKNIDLIQNSNDEKGKSILEQNLFKLKTPDIINSSVEGLVFKNFGKVYKLTGTFTPANQICAYLKYKDNNVKKELGPSLFSF